MAEQFIQVAPNSTGLKLRVLESTVGANVVEHQVIVIADSAGNLIPFPLALGAGGGLKVDGSGTPVPIRLQDGAGATLGTILAASQGDALAQSAALEAITHGYLWNGANWDKTKTASAANLAAQSGLGTQLKALPGNWSVVSAPAVSVVASAVKAAGAAGVRHVCTNVEFGFSAGTAIAATTMVINLRDGASGAGTILKTWQFALTATTIPPFSINLTGLSEVGTAATAMTLEFTALLTNLLEFCNIGGYDAS